MCAGDVAWAALSGPALLLTTSLLIQLRLSGTYDPHLVGPTSAAAVPALFSAPTDVGGWVYLLGLGALVPAVAEELLFRCVQKHVKHEYIFW